MPQGCMFPSRLQAACKFPLRKKGYAHGIALADGIGNEHGVTDSTGFDCKACWVWGPNVDGWGLLENVWEGVGWEKGYGFGGSHEM